MALQHQPRGPHPGRPAKRQAILIAATRVFLQRGYRGSSIDEIAAASEVSKQTIYNHFGDKDHLFLAVLRATQDDAGVARFATEVERTLTDSADLRRDLTALGRRWVEMVLREDVAALRRLVLAEWDRHPELLDVWRGGGPDVQRALERAIARQMERGVLDVADVGLAVHQLQLLLITEALTRALYGRLRLPSAEVDEIVATGVSLWLRAYRGTER